jgi:alpha-beta hydrolase superfamily lysophospholipase
VLLLLWLVSSYLVVDQLTSRVTVIKTETAPQICWGRIESVRLHTDDQQEIGGWFIPGQPNRPTVLLLHGNGGSRGACLDLAEWMVEAGYSTLLITLRAHGDSTGDRNDLGYSARHDVIAAVKWLEANHPGRVIIWGRSLGSAAAVFASGDLGERVSGYVLECPYLDLRTAVRNRLNARLVPPFNWPAYSGMVLTAPLVLGDVDRISPHEACGGIPKGTPVLLLTGGNDHLATPDEAYQLAARIGSFARVLVVDGAGHLELNRADPTRYRETGLQFLDECVSRGK